jgi:prevent-host-death family protein
MDTHPSSPAKAINAVKARENFGQMIDEVYYKGDLFIIERAGRPMAAVVPLSQLEALQKHHTPAVKSSKRKSKRTG